MVEVKKVKEPLIHISKSSEASTGKHILVRAIAILAAFVVSIAFATAYTGKNPFLLIGHIFDGAFGGKIRVWNFLIEMALLLGVSIAVVPAFKMKFWNLGADGQTLIGCLASASCMYYLGGTVDDGLLTVLMLVGSIVCSTIWAVIPAVFKAKWNTNETLFTLMMNYIAVQLVVFFLMNWFPGGQNYFSKFYAGYGNMPKLYHKYLLSILIVVVITAAMYVYLKYSKHGYELSVVGESQNTARYVGINVKQVIIRTMVLSGVICGIMGYLIVGGINQNIDADIVAGRGFTAIIVVWLAKFNPLYMVLTTFLVVFLQRGTGYLVDKLNLGLNALPEMITGLFFLFIIGCEFFIAYSMKFRKKKKVVKDFMSRQEAATLKSDEGGKE